ncbi:MFS transporter [Acetanaerobacterium elongatum]|uniref:MFS transporter, UMF1 family n=1 Tax=Acetanaerobacterium elongatum TaxID=258515 RepID=A0A1H0A0X4_9FIRM|nr:MFS transporter [Acetanaerobacterium elongatum]SDN27432.1 MFS transporter, UMF1 family [Acetanaerobacterium elongatum]
MKLSKAEKSWVLYDVANSAFTMIISTTIPIYFRSLVENSGADPSTATGIWGIVTSIAIAIMAILSPILGAIADYKGMKKKMFILFLVIGLIGGLSLSVTSDWVAYLLVFVLARVGYTACNVFYDSMLTDVTNDERIDYISAAGYAWGYIGSCIPFIAGIAVIFLKPFGMSTGMATQISFLFAVLWWGLLTIPLLKNVKQVFFLENRQDKITHAFSRLGATLKKIVKERILLYFIVAYFFYIDGVYTIISMATTYGGEVGIDSTSMILALLLTQFVAFPFAILAGKLGTKFGAMKMIKIYIVWYIAICLFGFQLDQQWEFWVLAVAVGLAQGGVQSLSRSYFGKLIPKEESNEYFGFFDIFGKFADFFGPLILSASAFIFKASKYGVLALIVLFIIGFIFLSLIPKNDTVDFIKPE